MTKFTFFTPDMEPDDEPGPIPQLIRKVAKNYSELTLMGKSKVSWTIFATKSTHDIYTTLKKRK